MLRQLKLLSVLLVALVVSGCASNSEIVYLPYPCVVPTEPALPDIDAGELWDKVGEDTYNDLLEREETIVGWAKEMESTLNYLCNK